MGRWTPMSEQTLSAPVSRAQTVNIRGATLRAIYIIWKRDLIRYWRDRTRVIASLAQPVLFLFVFGSGLSASLRGSSGGFGGTGSSLQYAQFIFPGIIGMSVLFTSIFSAMSIVWDREFGFLKEVLVAPIHRSAVAIGKTLGGATQAMFQGLVILILAPLVGVKLTFLGVIEIIPMAFLFAFAVSALGVAVAARMRTMQGFQMVMNFLMMPMFFLAGALFPLGANLPGWLTVLTRLDPASYGIDAIRRVVLSAAGVPSRVLDSLGLTLFGHSLSVWTEEAELVFFGAPIDDQVANVVMAQLLFLAGEDPEKDIWLYINSPGGSVYAGLAIYDTMQYVEPRVGAICMGIAASMAAVLLAGGAAGMRLSLPNTRVLIHQPSGGFSGQATDIQIHAQEILRVRHRLDEILAHHTGKPIEIINHDSDRDFFMSAE